MDVHLKFNGMPILYKTLRKKKEFSINFSGKTLNDLITLLVRKFGIAIRKALLDDKGNIDMEIRVVLNEKVYLMDNRMETTLNHGDTLTFMGAS